MFKNTIFAIVALASFATSQANGIGCPWATYPGPYMQSYGSLTNPNIGFSYGNLLLWEYNESSRPNSTVTGTKKGA